MVRHPRPMSLRMLQRKQVPTGRERTFLDDELLVSKSNVEGDFHYMNEAFLRVTGYGEAELAGQPHSLLRHPDMPACIFRLVWTALAKGKEVFAYFLNLTKEGDHFWELAHITPIGDGAGGILGYHALHRTAQKGAVRMIEGIYREARRAEAAHSDKEPAVQAGLAYLESMLLQLDMSYNEFVLSLESTHA